MTTPAYQELEHRFDRLHRWEHLSAIAGWDQAAKMPAKSHHARALALAELQTHLHHLITQPDWQGLLASAQQESLDEEQQANVREMTREWRAANALPADLVERLSLATSACEHAWRTQRQQHDWAGFMPNFAKVLEATREKAERLGQALGCSPYDALLDQYEPGTTSQSLDRVFGDLETWLPGLIKAAQERQSQSTWPAFQGPFPIDAQKRLCQGVVQALGFDFEAGRLDESTHPFCGGVPEDVRITTRYREDDFLSALMGTVHETGHACYEQGRRRDRLSQPVSRARSMGIHESQSLAFEMQLGCSLAFAEFLSPRLVEAFGPQDAFEPRALQAHLTRVQPGFIRVEADEVCYPAHVILRYRIERDLVEGRMAIEDIPSRWEESMHHFLGLEVGEQHGKGCLQDIHWPEGLIGYFPSYTLGAMYAAQWFASIRSSNPDLDAQIRQGQFASIHQWLRRNIWETGSLYSTDELAVRASGETLNPAHFKQHLTHRYLG